jgi:hypothetical protein
MPTVQLKDYGEEEGYVNYHLWSDGVKIGDIYRRLAIQDADNCMSQKEAYEWVSDIQRWDGCCWLAVY